MTNMWCSEHSCEVHQSGKEWWCPAGSWRCRLAWIWK